MLELNVNHKYTTYFIKSQVFFTKCDNSIFFKHFFKTNKLALTISNSYFKHPRRTISSKPINWHLQ